MKYMWKRGIAVITKIISVLLSNKSVDTSLCRSNDDFNFAVNNGF